MGHKTVVPCPVMSRVAWFGIQTRLASSVLSTLVVTMFPGLRSLDTNSVLGRSAPDWIAFLALWALQVLIMSSGIQMIRGYMVFAGVVRGTWPRGELIAEDGNSIRRTGRLIKRSED